jgi:AcrR family transcriptional regulator
MPFPLACAAHSAERKPKGRGFERHDEILAAAARLFVELGIESVSTRRIAQAAGISQTSLYVYFPTKAAILEALCHRCFSKLVELFRQEAEGGGGPLEQLRRLMRTYVRFGVEHADEYRLAFMVKQKQLAGDHPADLAALFEPGAAREGLSPGMQCFLMMQDRFAELSGAGRLRLDPRLAAQGAWAAGHGLVTLLITMSEFPWAPFDGLLDAVIDIQLHGALEASPASNH